MRKLILVLLLCACKSNTIKLGDDGPPPPPSVPVVDNHQPLIENFESLPIGPIADGATVGNYVATVKNFEIDTSPGAPPPPSPLPQTFMSIDTTNNPPGSTGTKTLKIHLDMKDNKGAQLKSILGNKLFANNPQHLYGRVKMYFSSNSTSNHWQVWGMSGNIPNGTPNEGKHTEENYAVTTNGFFPHYISDSGTECGFQSVQALPVMTWNCYTWEVDSKNIKWRLAIDGVPVTAFNVDPNWIQINECNTPYNTPWYGPVFDTFYFGALSAGHQMTKDLDVWIDDLYVDTAPVSCSQ